MSGGPIRSLVATTVLAKTMAIRALTIMRLVGTLFVGTLFVGTLFPGPPPAPLSRPITHWISDLCQTTVTLLN